MAPEGKFTPRSRSAYNVERSEKGSEAINLNEIKEKNEMNKETLDRLLKRWEGVRERRDIALNRYKELKNNLQKKLDTTTDQKLQEEWSQQLTSLRINFEILQAKVLQADKNRNVKPMDGMELSQKVDIQATNLEEGEKWLGKIDEIIAGLEEVVVEQENREKSENEFQEMNALFDAPTTQQGSNNLDAEMAKVDDMFTNEPEETSIPVEAQPVSFTKPVPEESVSPAQTSAPTEQLDHQQQLQEAKEQTQQSLNHLRETKTAYDAADEVGKERMNDELVTSFDTLKMNLNAERNLIGDGNTMEDANRLMELEDIAQELADVPPAISEDLAKEKTKPEGLMDRINKGYSDAEKEELKTAAEQALKDKNLDEMGSADRAMLIGQVMMQHGVNVSEDGEVTPPESRMSYLLNKFAGLLQYIGGITDRLKGKNEKKEKKQEKPESKEQQRTKEIIEKDIADTVGVFNADSLFSEFDPSAKNTEDFLQNMNKLASEYKKIATNEEVEKFIGELTKNEVYETEDGRKYRLEYSVQENKEGKFDLLEKQDATPNSQAPSSPSEISKEDKPRIATAMNDKFTMLMNDPSVEKLKGEWRVNVGSGIKIPFRFDEQNHQWLVKAGEEWKVPTQDLQAEYIASWSWNNTARGEVNNWLGRLQAWNTEMESIAKQS